MERSSWATVNRTAAADPDWRELTAPDQLAERGLADRQKACRLRHSEKERWQLPGALGGEQ
jgi:hypothetical protein